MEQKLMIISPTKTLLLKKKRILSQKHRPKNTDKSLICFLFLLKLYYIKIHSIFHRL